jgi:hypothetical protein
VNWVLQKFTDEPKFGIFIAVKANISIKAVNVVKSQSSWRKAVKNIYGFIVNNSQSKFYRY